MTEKEEIIKALDKAYSLRTTDQIDWEGKFKVAPQSPEGISIWAKLLAAKAISPYDALWAFREGKKKEWLAVRIQYQGTIEYFNLKSPDDREDFQSFSDAAWKDWEKNGNSSLEKS